MATGGKATRTAEKKELFDGRIVFQFYSKSRDVPPGEGPGEKIPPEMMEDFKELSAIKDWRKKLSNFWISEMVVDGLKWSSVEHFYHANKYRVNCPAFYRRFSLSYEPDKHEPEWIKNLPENLATDPAVAKALGGKTGKYKKVSYRPKDIVLDKGFFNDDNSEKVMKEGQLAKYQQSEELRRVLLATKNAKLVHFVRGTPPVVFYDTMTIRRHLQEDGVSSQLRKT